MGFTDYVVHAVSAATSMRSSSRSWKWAKQWPMKESGEQRSSAEEVCCHWW